jgi:peroxiredoxin Q/BCP
MPLTIGQAAPDFSLPCDNDTILSLTDFKGKNLVLYFYPKDHTSGCTRESCDFRDYYTEFQSLNTVVIGISKDSVSSHQRFKATYQLPFALLSDPEGIVCQAYGVMGEKKMYGKTFYGIIRSTFLIDEHGILQAIWRNVSVTNHVQAVLTALKEIRGISCGGSTNL